jgi:PleD family two-component response regulator
LIPILGTITLFCKRYGRFPVPGNRMKSATMLQITLAAHGPGDAINNESNSSRATTRILAVDDFVPYRLFISSMLQEQPDLQVICGVSDGLQAVEKAQELQPDLILMDIGMPGINGIEAAR